MNFPLGWFNVRHIPFVAERVQTDTYLACVILSETVGQMLDSFVRDYLVARVEVMLSHSSKGAHLVHFAQPEGARLVADPEWLVP